MVASHDVAFRYKPRLCRNTLQKKGVALKQIRSGTAPVRNRVRLEIALVKRRAVNRLEKLLKF